MLKEVKSAQEKLEVVYIENLVPQDHLLRAIDKYVDFSFIRTLTKDLYCENNGRPAIDPVVFFKILFIGYLFGIRSERQLIKEIEVNVAYRWFLGFSLTDKVPDHSTLSQNRKRRFKDINIFQNVFDEIVLQAISRNLVDGKILYTDSTHLKANANKKKFVEVEVEKSVKDYVKELDEAVEKDREEHGKKPLKKKEYNLEIKTTKQSTTDPESGYMMRDGKPEGFFYLDHRTVDGKYNIITDVYVTPGNVNDVEPYIGRLERQINRFNFNTKYVGVDAGYFTNLICKQVLEHNLKAVMGYRLGPHEKGKYTKNKFQYVKELDIYVCPDMRAMDYKTTTREGYREYVSKAENCSNCPYKDNCLTGKNDMRTIRRHVWENYKEEVASFTKTDKGKYLYKRRKETIERSFADSKELHGLRYCHFRGIGKVSEQCLLTAACQNMKKIARALSYLFINLFRVKLSY